MAGRGAAPKPNHQRARDTARRIDARAIQVPDQPHNGVIPTLPQGEWLDATLLWWNTWSHAPQAALFIATDWMFLIETAYIANAFYGGNLTLGPELRLRCAKFGATTEDRSRLRMLLVPVEDDDKNPKLASVTKLATASYNLDED